MTQYGSLFARKFPTVICSGCKGPMDYVCSEAAPDGRRLATYRCQDCRTEAVRLVRLDENS